MAATKTGRHPDPGAGRLAEVDNRFNYGHEIAVEHPIWDSDPLLWKHLWNLLLDDGSGRMFFGLPDSLLYWLACDVAQRCLDTYEQETGNQVDPRVTEYMGLVRQCAMGALSRKEFEPHAMPNNLSPNNWEDHRHPYSAPTRSRTRSHDRNRLHVPYAVAKQTACSCGLFAAGGTIMRHIEWAHNRQRERNWVHAKLRYLCEVWRSCGARAPWLLYEDKCPIPWEEPKQGTSLVAMGVLGQ